MLIILFMTIMYFSTEETQGIFTIDHQPSAIPIEGIAIQFCIYLCGKRGNGCILDASVMWKSGRHMHDCM